MVWGWFELKSLGRVGLSRVSLWLLHINYILTDMSSVKLAVLW